MQVYPARGPPHYDPTPGNRRYRHTLTAVFTHSSTSMNRMHCREPAAAANVSYDHHCGYDSQLQPNAPNDPNSISTHGSRSWDRRSCDKTAAAASVPYAGPPPNPCTNPDTSSPTTHLLIQIAYPLVGVDHWIGDYAIKQQLLRAYRTRGPPEPAPAPILADTSSPTAQPIIKIADPLTEVYPGVRYNAILQHLLQAYRPLGSQIPRTAKSRRLDSLT